MRWCLAVLAVLAAGVGGRAEDPAGVLDRIAAQEARLPGIGARVEAARAAGRPVAYPLADFRIAERFCAYGREDVAHGRVARAAEVAGEVAVLLDRAEREMDRGVAAPRLLPGRLEIRDGAFWGRCETAGVVETRPVFLTGYGHFDPVIADLPLFGEIGINVIQIEIGPNSVVRADGTVDTGPITGRIAGALDRARDHGVQVCLLTSPHYFPGWAFERWPELRLDDGPGHVPPFIKHSVEAPQAREIQETFLRTLIPLIKDHPALHSICLSNEPVYEFAPADPFRLPLWRAHLAETYGDVGALNAAHGTAHAAFGEVPHPPFDFRGNLPALYDAVRFNQARFSGWHGWMAGIVRGIAPDLPCHAKVMPLVWDRNSVLWGTDPLEFAELGGINGNDCYFSPNHGVAPWASEWQTQGMYYDLQRSMKHAPIFNSENHVIPDRTTAHVDPGHVYTALWQGAIHGQGASATWAWARTYDAASDFEGLILHRAACTAAMSRVALDLMRLSREVHAIQRAQPEVAILWSNAAQVHDPRFTSARNRLYEALNFLGVPIGFVTEEQLARDGTGRHKVVVAAGARAVARPAAEALRAFRDRGGHVVSYGASNFEIDAHGRALPPFPFTREIPRALRDAPLAEALREALAAAGVAPGVDLRTVDGAIPYGVEWRGAELDGTPLINLVNLTRDPVTVRLPEGTWTDLITGEPLDRTPTLATNTPVLAAGR